MEKKKKTKKEKKKEATTKRKRRQKGGDDRRTTTLAPKRELAKKLGVKLQKRLRSRDTVVGPTLGRMNFRGSRNSSREIQKKEKEEGKKRSGRVTEWRKIRAAGR